MQWRVVVGERSREDKRTRGLADYLNANTMLYRGALFPSRLFYNSICDPRASGGGAATGFRGSRDGLGVSLFVHCNVVKSLRFHYDYIVLSFRLSTYSLSLFLFHFCLCNLLLYLSTSVLGLLSYFHLYPDFFVRMQSQSRSRFHCAEIIIIFLGILLVR